MYILEYKRQAAKDIQKIAEPFKINILERIQTLKVNPYPVDNRKLKKFKEKKFKIRIGDYCVVYTVSEEEQIVTIELAKHRRESYRFLLL